MEMINWTKPSGLQVQTNDRPATIEAAENLGWERQGKDKPKDDKPKKSNKPKDDKGE